ncbi:MAG: nucleotidyltransferase family protein [Deltaproteobacteria bacterium]|nr:nucleotidyltransferase family protein [Deltaproteobacteria bacterium]
MSARAFVLAAGLGTRLRPLTFHRPKPLLPVCGITPLGQALALCARHGIRDVVVNAHHLPDQVAAFVERQTAARVHLQVERPEILGTGGGLRAALDVLDDPFAVVNGDVLCDADLGALLAMVAQEGVDAAMLLYRSPDAARLGVVAMDAAGVVARLADVARIEGMDTPLDTHFTGIHALRRRALRYVPSGRPSCIVRTAYKALVPLGRVRASLHEGTWRDVGHPASYIDACMDALAGRLRLPVDPRRIAAAWASPDGTSGGTGACDLASGAVLIPPYWIGPGALVEAGATVGPWVVIGDGARVRVRARLARSVVWDGVEVEPGSALERVVVHDGGVLSVG